VTDKASAAIGKVADVATSSEKIVNIMADDGAKAALHREDAWDGLKNVGGDLLDGNLGQAATAAGDTVTQLGGDLVNGLGDLVSDGWDGVKNIADGIGSLLGLGGGDNHPKGNMFQDGDPSSLPEGVYQGYGAPDSDGNMPVIYAAANGADSVDYDPSTGGFTEYNGNGIVARPRPNHHQRRLRASARQPAGHGDFGRHHQPVRPRPNHHHQRRLRASAGRDR
jgi:hypothetical protein